MDIGRRKNEKEIVRVVKLSERKKADNEEESMIVKITNSGKVNLLMAV